jgi:hypothetical protein
MRDSAYDHSVCGIMPLMRTVTVIEAPTSAGGYAPGQEGVRGLCSAQA